MTTPVFPLAPPSVSEVVVTWLRPLGDPNGVGTDRPSGAVLPYRMVTPVAGTDQYKVMQRAIVSVHTFHNNMDDAESEAQLTHQRMLLLGPPFSAPQQVTISNNRVVTPISCDTVQIPTWVDYQDNTIRRFVARYEVALHFMAT
ncbi:MULTISPECIES: hypothetical protein [unclassified Mycobacterium]|uniref:hypothetical protein n=1 Tax=unclassified Mycobacterium TaxID=2642494 RepID=UPI000AECB4FD|nr:MULTISPECIES: hypothetical protein [unclassified Mycobacterium]